MVTDGAVLVVGADGMIGSALACHLAETGLGVIRTSRRGGANTTPLDLAEPPATWQLPDGISTAVLCAAITSTEVCRARPDEARRVNVAATVELARRLVARGSRVVFLSTNMVFDGSVPFVRADAPRSPRTAYGRMKADAEEEILSLGDQACVVRLTKVTGSAMPILAKWREALGRGGPIRPLSDMVMAPISVKFVAAALEGIISHRLAGILQISAAADLPYADVARRLAMKLGCPMESVQPVTVAASGICLEHLPRYTTLDASAMRDRLGIEPPDPWVAVEEAIR